MTSPSMVHRSGDTLVVRSVVSGNQLFLNDNDTESYAEEDASEDNDFTDEPVDSDDNKTLPECKVRRNYSCSNCYYFTQNPRHFLYHLRDVHKEKVRIYECPNCLYASKHLQKLLRHRKMVHGNYDNGDLIEEVRSKDRTSTSKKRKRTIAVEEHRDREQPDSDMEGDLGGGGGEDDAVTIKSESVDDASSKPSTELKCSLCSFRTRHQGQLTRHEKQEHIKTKFFRCTKCSYVTHIKARFTKHVKYHSMPMIKCDLCDFRTPYKWNLDRHYKNHNGHGAFRCSACNFTADIKQSLTVHEMNHHVPPVGQAAGLGVGRRRNKVGASDTTAAEEAAAEAAAAAAAVSTGGMNPEGSRLDFAKAAVPDKHEGSAEVNKKSPKIKISLKKLKTTSTQEQNERHNFDTDFIHPDDIIHHANGNIYIKNKCKLCNYKSAWDTEMAKHERKVHNVTRDKGQQATNVAAVKKTPRPIPNLIPIQSTLAPAAMAASSALKIPVVQNRPVSTGQYLANVDEYTGSADNIMSQKDLNDMCAKSANSSLRDFTSLFGDDVFETPEKSTATSAPAAVPNVTAESKTSPASSKHLAESASTLTTTMPVAGTSLFKKKNASFFDKLKEKLMTDAGESCSLTCKWCGHESKCLSESAGHQKTCGKQQTNTCNLTPSVHNISSTRCQYCRQRCKSSIDLHTHLQVCTEANKPVLARPETDPFELKPDITIELEDEPAHSDTTEPHPMENIVFVWNNIPAAQSSIDEPVLNDRTVDDNNSIDLSVRVPSPESECSYPENDSIPENTVSPAKMSTHGNDIDLVAEGRRVFKCPHCSFWATTASRFHVHIVGHLNKKPFECSLCAYRSNWRWDITKHIRLKSVRDPAHEKARVLMTDETGRRNYSKYNKYLTQLRSNDPSSDSNAANRRAKSTYDASPMKVSPSGGGKPTMELPKLTRAPTNMESASRSTNPLRPPPPLKAANEMYFHSFNEQKKRTSSDAKKTLFKCKKCNFRDASRENILLHVKGHYRQENSGATGNADSDERHCRLKHSGDVRVVIGSKNGSQEKVEIDDQSDEPDHVDVIQNGTYKCTQCPYSVNSQEDFDRHVEMHVPRNNSSMKCYFCPYYVVQKYELFDHLKLHGVSNPEDYVNRAMQGRDLVASDNTDVHPFKRYRHRGGPFKCEFCSYNVTKRHLLHQHLRVHGVAVPANKSSLNKSGSDRESDAMDSEDFGADEFEEVMSPPDVFNCSLNEDQILLDVPLVWVSRDGKFTKMYKCRFCPHVNLRKVNIQEHEKMHSIREKNTNSPRNGDEHHCTECSYICNNAGVLSSHLKVHQSLYGKIHCLVDTNKTDEEQVSELTRLLNVKNNDAPDAKETAGLHAASSLDERTNCHELIVNDERVLYFCEHCPARFLQEKEFNIHNRFHGIRLFYRCEYCSYAARQRPHLLSHGKVHTDEYQERTKLLQAEYPIHKDHPPPPRTAVIVNGSEEGVGSQVWVVISNGEQTSDLFTDTNENTGVKKAMIPSKEMKASNKNFVCTKCPARFFKNDMLQYHMTLHGCNNPYKCTFCDYGARTSSNLQKHVRIHEQQPYVVPKTYSTLGTIPLSGTDLFQQKSEAQKQSLSELANHTGNNQHAAHIDPQFGTLMHGNPKFIYPTYLKNGRMKEKRYKCHKCPSAFEKREQYKIHLSLHGSNQRYKCENCDYSVKYYANYIQHIRKHQMNADAQAAKKPEFTDEYDDDVVATAADDDDDEDLLLQDTVTNAPFSKLAIKTLNSSAKRGPLKLSVADRQTLMILQQRRASNASSTKDTATEDKKLFWCPHCPYTNYRRDAVDNHVNRHISVSGIRSNYTCDHCDYTVPQSHFLREHVKIHFQAQKSHQPDGFMVCNKLELMTKKCSDESEDNESVQDDSSGGGGVIFQDSGTVNDDTRFKPNIDADILAAFNNNNDDESKIFINPENGEFLENSTPGVTVKSETKEQKKSL
ncbi:uncharacterized protein CBL_05614 [Carabus blaptoides fortunei]